MTIFLILLICLVIVLIFIIISLIFYILRKHNEHQPSVQLIGSSTIKNSNYQRGKHLDRKVSNNEESNEVKKIKMKNRRNDMVSQQNLETNNADNEQNSRSTLSPLIVKPKSNRNNGIYYV